MNQLTFTDKILARTILPFIPRFVTPNMITSFRFLTIPFIVYFLLKDYYGWALFIFFFSSISDAIDGSLARVRNQITRWGEIFDPFADKLLIGVSALILVSKFLSFYLTITIIALEVCIVISAYYRKYSQGVPVRAELSGKIKMVLQSLGVGAILIAVYFQAPVLIAVASYLLNLSIIFAIISLVVYKSI